MQQGTCLSMTNIFDAFSPLLCTLPKINNYLSESTTENEHGLKTIKTFLTRVTMAIYPKTISPVFLCVFSQPKLLHHISCKLNAKFIEYVVWRGKCFCFVYTMYVAISNETLLYTRDLADHLFCFDLMRGSLVYEEDIFIRRDITVLKPGLVLVDYLDGLTGDKTNNHLELLALSGICEAACRYLILAEHMPVLNRLASSEKQLALTLRLRVFIRLIGYFNRHHVI